MQNGKKNNVRNGTFCERPLDFKDRFKLCKNTISVINF